MRTVYAQKNKKIILGRQGEDKAVRVVWPGIVSDWSSLYGGGSFQLSVRRFSDENAYPVAVEVNGDDIRFTVTSAETAIAGIGKCELTYIANGTIAKSATWETVVLNSLTGQTPSEPPEEPAKSWFTAIQGQIGDLADLETEAKNNLVSAINEAAKTGSGGANIALRVEGGYIQYTVDGVTWANLIAVADLKGAKGDPGKDGSPGKDGVAATIAVGTVSTGAAGSAAEVVNRGTSNAAVFDFKIPQGEPGKDGSPGKDGVDGITPTIGDNGNWYIGSTDTGKPSRGVAGATGAAGPAGKDGQTPVKGVDYWTAADKSEIVADTAAAIDLTVYAKIADVPTKTSELTNDSGFVAASELAAELAGKQDIISDLATIRSGAAKGATALQSVPNSYRTAEAQDVIDAGKQDALIQSGATVGQIAKITAVDDTGKPTAWQAVDMPSGGGSGVQPDWNQNDVSAPDYVKNRPFYTGDTVESLLLEETTATFAKKGDNYQTEISVDFSLEIGETYKVSWDGTVYSCVGYDFRGAVIGNQYILTSTSDTGEPFFAGVDSNNGNLIIITRDTSASHTISISKSDDKVKKIDGKYIPELYMDKVNPTGTGSFSLNRRANTTIGNYSFTEGSDTTASGDSSHAEGVSTTASGDSSHAEGMSTMASGLASHAEGYHTTASSNYSHAEGCGTTASSNYSHAEGKYNIEDTANKYAHIVGNGTSFTYRSNAHTLDWSGNAWFAGTVEGKALIISSSTEGSTKKFKITVDDRGTITATEVS